MRIISAVIGLVVSLALFAGFATAEQADPGAQSGQQMKQQGAMTQNPQTVKQVQQALSDKGYYKAKVDGKWGPKTESALKQFQSAQGMQANGQLDQQTLASLGVSGAAAGGQSAPTGTQGGAGGQQGGQTSGGQQGGGKY